jgi:hypothetical protein
VTVTTGVAAVVSALVCFFEESATQAISKSGMRDAARGLRELRGANWDQRNTRREMDIGVEAEADRAPVFESRGI